MTLNAVAIPSFLRRGSLYVSASLLAILLFPSAALALCCSCHVVDTQQPFCLDFGTPPEVGQCGDAATAATIQHLATSDNMIGNIICESAALNDSQCRTIPSGVCRAGTPVTPSGLVSFMQTDLNLNNPPTAGQSSNEAGVPDALIPDMNATFVGEAATGTTNIELAIQIPGLTFGDAIVSGNSVIQPQFAQYVAAIYRYAVGIVTLVATIMIVYGGFLYLVGSASGDISKGKSIIMDAVAGMILLLGGYAILSVINPATLSLTGIRTLNVQNVPFELAAESMAFANAGRPTAGAGSIVNGQGQAVSAPTNNVTPSYQSGDVTIFNFNYQPSTDVNWALNQAEIMVPTRLLNQSTPVHAYVFIHGWNNGHAPSSQAGYARMLRSSLQRIAGNKNVIVIAPHYMAGSGSTFMQGFTIASLMNAAQQSIRSNPQLARLGIRDVAVGAHSAGTCAGKLSQAARNPVPNQIALVAYDGCVAGDMSAAGVYTANTLLLDFDDMGRDRQFSHTPNPPFVNAISIWQLRQTECPQYVLGSAAAPPAAASAAPRPAQTIAHVRGCYQNASGNVKMFVTTYGHGPSVEKMTDWAFQQLYPQNDR